MQRLREAAREELEIREADIPFDALPRCESLCVTNVRMGLLPLSSVDGRALADGPALEALATRVARLDDDYFRRSFAGGGRFFTPPR